MSLSVAKNAMRRAIADLYYRPLTTTEKDRIWKYFDSRCAYCYRRIDRALRHGHMDHLDCSASVGGNYIRNRVLACKECNGNEKREKNWKTFLRSKCADTKTFDRRKNKILEWQSQFAPLPLKTLNAEAQAAKAELEDAVKEFESKFIRFRGLIRGVPLIQKP